MATRSTIKDLQKRCKAMGLDTTGKRSDLLKRLGRSNPSEGGPVEGQPAELGESFSHCDALLAAKSDIAGEEDMKDGCKEALQKALDEEHLEIEDVGGEVVAGNPRGLDILRELKIHKVRIGSLEEGIATRDAEVTTRDARIRSLEERVQGLCTSLEGYRKLRERFISTYKRDVLKKETNKDKEVIGSGNRSPHGGDASLDAQLYEEGPGGRRDYQVFKSLYGLLPHVVVRITHPPTIAVLNEHASAVSSKYKAVSAKFRALFAGFIKAFEEEGEGFDEEYLDDGRPNRVKSAYWAFWNCIGDEVSNVNPADPE